MALEHAILVSLEERSGSGYELARRFERSIGFFWSASHQQIYKTLKRMAERDWVSVEEVPQEGRPDKKVYRPTPAGVAELRRWLAEPTTPADMRFELAVKVRGASFGDVGAVIDEIQRYREHHAQRVEAFKLFEKRDFPDPDRLSDQQLHQYLVLLGGVRVNQAAVDWCDDMLRALKSRETEGTTT